MTVNDLIKGLSVLDPDTIIYSYDDSGNPKEASFYVVENFFMTHINDGTNKLPGNEKVIFIHGNKNSPSVII